MKRSFILVLTTLACADNTRTWTQDRFEDFDKGTPTKVSLRSDGRLLLAPRFRQLSDPQFNYIWSIVQDSKGRLYAGGGSPGKVVRFTSDSKFDTVLEVKELEIHALALDERDNLYAATSPDPKVYKITPDGKSSVFFEPKDAKYIWGVAWDPGGWLYIATGDKGEVFRVDREGKGGVYFSSDDIHVRSLAVERRANQTHLIIGTDPSGLIIRVSPPAAGQTKGSGFVLYQAGKKEITALAVSTQGPDAGSVFAAAVGDRAPRPTPLPSAPAPPQQPVIPAPTGPPPVFIPGAPMPAVVPGGTEVFQILPDGSPKRLWSSRDDVVYSLAFSAADRLLLGTGNKARLFQLDSDDLNTVLLKAPATQITALFRAASGMVYAGTGNVGKIFELGREYDSEGTFESEVFDARNFARWGRITWNNQTPPGTSVTLATRSGNVDDPARNWSPWSRPYGSHAGEAVESPGARFLQWKVTLSSAGGARTPLVDEVAIAYLAKNLAPVIEEVQATPSGYRFNVTPAPATPPAPTITLPAIGRARPPASPPVTPVRFDPPAQMTAQKGSQGVRWAVHDDNDDQMVFKLFIRGVNETSWKLLKERLTDRFYSWDANAFPDGWYVAKVVASDAPSNTEGEALTDEKVSDPFVIDNTPPALHDLRAVRDVRRIRVTFRAVDALNWIRRAEFSVDGGEWQKVVPADQIFDAPEESFNFLTGEVGPGEHTVAVRVYDKADNVQVEKVVVP